MFFSLHHAARLLPVALFAATVGGCILFYDLTPLVDRGDATDDDVGDVATGNDADGALAGAGCWTTRGGHSDPSFPYWRMTRSSMLRSELRTRRTLPGTLPRLFLTA